MLYALQTRTVILFLALSNFAWYFPKSKTVQYYGSEVISFCASCPWYFDGVYANKPFILLFATLFMLFNRWWGYLITAVISGYRVIEGIILISTETGFVGGLSERIELISTNFDLMVWRFLDWQYLLALIIFIVALGYLIANVVKIKQKIVTSNQ